MEIVRGIFVVVAACAFAACGDSGSSDGSNGDAGNDASSIDSSLADGSNDATGDGASHDADAISDAAIDARTDVASDADAGPPPYDPAFPRLGLYPLGGSQRYDADAFRAVAAKHHVVIVSQWPGWQLSRTMSMAAVMKDIKARSTIGTKTFIYVNDNERPDPKATGDDVWDELTAQKWWLYATGTTGAPVVPVA
jgi:hypothetical protein